MDDGDVKISEAIRDGSMDGLFDAVPLFPLPNVVLLPHAILPLHIFESRYRAMTRDAIASGTPIAMALLRSGWEAVTPEIDPIVCVGRIVKHERLADGRFNLLLEGFARARIESSTESDEAASGEPYKIARLTPIHERHGMEIDLERERVRLRELLDRSSDAKFPVVTQFRELLGGPTSTATIADLLAFHLLEDISLKQDLLSEADVPTRIERLLGALSTQLSEGDRPIDPGLN